MNNIPFKAKPDFPLDSDALQNMQDTYKQLGSALAALFGTNVILSGVQESGSTLTSGIVVLGGEVYPFKASAKANYLKIVSKTNKVTTPEGEYEVLTEKWVESTAAATSYNLANIRRVSLIADFDTKANKTTEVKATERKYFAIENDFIKILKEDTLLHYNDVGITHISGVFRLKTRNNIAANGWMDLFNLKTDGTTNIDRNLLVPRYIQESSYLNGGFIFTGDLIHYAGVPIKLWFRISQSGAVEIFGDPDTYEMFQTDVVDEFQVFINISFFNPKIT